MDKFHAYFKAMSMSERKTFADSVGTSVAYLWQIIYKQRRCSESLAIEICKASNGAVRFEALRPDVDWEYVKNSANSIAGSDQSDLGERVKASDDVQPPTGGSRDSEQT
ncbi:hypothetical protein WK80_22360 [Burkholderia multivorans]|uniref:transcriptional regulator n=1 Tax=Burkholderia multivorans TaxID=87883 RepID=UPI0007586A15|nr:YdaS family helix-turn-helix protein [Burkholderia multivorans]KVV22335.1 hypothetical protein WK80_22360 [Burkholderia multivorans]MBU9203095.1 helix-turn-helix domain-containing protein [Burkholderia multivorans]MCA8385334.1 helix-turn-helix domain-containing protein [Burkholderia multivorans]